MANTKLTRAMTTKGSSIKGTFSVWLKKSNLTNGEYDVYQHNYSSDYRFIIRFDSSDRLAIGDYRAGWSMEYCTNRSFRDVHGWFHIYIAIDRSLSTASDRQQIWINGVRETSFANNTNYSQQTSGVHSSVVSMNNGLNYTSIIGGRENNTDYFNGLMSHLYWVDGSVIDVTEFGSTDATTGEWKINTSPTIASYGTNGHSHFKDVASVNDASSNNNHFTSNGTGITKTEDCPSNVFATINPLTLSATKWNLEYGNLRTNGHASGAGNAWRSVYGTLGASSGKYYFEMKVTRTASDPNNFRVGIIDAEQMKQTADNASFINESRGYGYQGTNGNVVNGGANTSYGNSYTANDIIGCAFDLDNHKIYWSKNGAWQNSGDPTSGSTGTGSALNLATGYTYLPAVSHYYDDDRIEFNFGNGYFGTTAVASAGTNASGNGIFEFDVPTGYTALSTKGLNL